MNKTQYKIFLSSHQKEFVQERKALKAYIEGDVLLRKFFDIFIFEASPAVDSTSQELYHKEVEASTIYIGLLGDRYGAQSFILTVQSEVVRKRFESIAELIAEVYSSLIAFLESMGKLCNVPFDKAFCDGATWDDIDSDKVETFLEKAKNARKFAISSASPKEKVLKQMNLAYENRLTNSAILLFGKAPQRFFISSEVKCLHFHGQNVAKPIPSYQIYKGSLFELADQALDFVMSKLNRNIGTREKSNDVAVNYEIPAAILSEAIINAIAHRDYTSNGSIQVMVFSDRVEIWNPGHLPPPKYDDCGSFF